MTTKTREHAERPSSEVEGITLTNASAAKLRPTAPSAAALAQLYTILSAESVDPRASGRHRVLRRALPDDPRRVRDDDRRRPAEGRVPDALSADTLATALVAVLDGLRLQDQIDHEALDVEQVFSDLLDFFVRE